MKFDDNYKGLTLDHILQRINMSLNFIHGIDYYHGLKTLECHLLLYDPPLALREHLCTKLTGLQNGYKSKLW